MTKSIHELSSDELRRIVAIKEQIEELQLQVASLTEDGAVSEPLHKGRRMSAAGRARIAAAARARWARQRIETEPVEKKQRKFSTASRAKLAAAAKERWAKAKAAGKTRL